MSFGFEGYALTPGHHDEFFTQEGQITWGRWDQQKISQALLDKDTVDSGNSTTTLLRPGLALGKLSTGQLTHWNPLSDMETASEGSRDFVGFFQENMDLGWLGSTKERLIYCMVGGNVRADSIVIPGQATAGISGDDYEILLREAAAGQFLFDDDLNRSVAQKTRHNMTAAEISGNAVTLTVADHNTHLFLYDANAPTTITLPAPIPGLKFTISTFGENIILEGPATGEFYLDRDTPTAVNNDTFTAINDQTIKVYGVATTDSVYKYITDPIAT